MDDEDISVSKIGCAVILVLLLAFPAAVACNIVSLPFWTANTVVNSGKGIIERTVNPDNVIYNYEWFHRQYGDLLAMGPKLENAQRQLDSFEASAGARSTWTFDDKQEHARLSSIVLGLENQRAGLVQDYNARASMSNRSIFMGTTVPSQVQ